MMELDLELPINMITKCHEKLPILDEIIGSGYFIHFELLARMLLYDLTDSDGYW